MTLEFLAAMFVLMGLQAVSTAAASVVIKLPPGALVPASQDYDRKTYAAIDFPVKHFAAALKQAEEVAGGSLITRGEAHLTVLTPPEYMRIEGKARKKILSEMKEAARDEGALKPVCIGRGQTDLNGKTEFTYFIVVEANGLRAIREKYHLQEFYPHITLGFTKRDLHIEDGVHKDKSSCLPDLAFTP